LRCAVKKALTLLALCGSSAGIAARGDLEAR
jgi:hypothetical protein